MLTPHNNCDNSAAAVRCTPRPPWGTHLSTALCAVLLILAGCGLKEQTSTLEQKQRESIAEKTTANVVRESLVAPAPMTLETVAPDGSKSTFTVPAVANTTTATQTGAEAASDSSASGASVQTDKFPAWVAFIGYGVGGLLAILVVWLILRGSRTARTLTGAVDGVASDAVEMLKSEAMTSTDPAVAAKLATFVNRIEKSKQDWLK